MALIIDSLSTVVLERVIPSLCFFIICPFLNWSPKSGMAMSGVPEWIASWRELNPA